MPIYGVSADFRYCAWYEHCLGMDSVSVILQIRPNHWLAHSVVVLLLPVKAERDGLTKWSSGGE